jgi:SnoaL-like domain
MSQENVELVEAAFAALDRGDLDGLLALFHPEVEFRSLVAEAEGRTYKGHDGVREWWDSVVQALGGLRYERVGSESFRDWGITPMGVIGTVEGVEVPQAMWVAWRVRDGLISWWASFRTEREALEAVGLRE